MQITRDRRQNGSVTYALRVRIRGSDHRVPLGNTADGWDESRADQARRQLLAKIELGQWSPESDDASGNGAEPTFREIATDWLDSRKHNPAIRASTTELNEVQLRRYLTPFFGELRPSQISKQTIRRYRDSIHRENAQIQAAADAGRPLRDPRTGLAVRTLSNGSINKTLRTLAMVLDDAEDAGWVDRNVARGRRSREPVERRRHRGTLDPDELEDLLDAAAQLDSSRRKPETLERAARVKALRDEDGLPWTDVAQMVGVAESTVFYLYRLQADPPAAGVRRALLATLALAGLRVTELCMLDTLHVDLGKARLHVTDSKTEAGVRVVDIHPRLLGELASFRAGRSAAQMDAPAFPTMRGTRRNKDNVRQKVVEPAVARANANRAQRGDPPIRAHVTPHTFRRTYITYAIAAGFDLPYVQAQVGHSDPTITLSVYAQVMRRADRDQLRTEIRALLGIEQPKRRPSPSDVDEALREQRPIGKSRVRATEKAGKGRALTP